MSQQFEYSPQSELHVRHLQSLGLLAHWPNPDKKIGFSWTPVEIMRLNAVRARLVKGDDPSNPLCCLQERIDGILEACRDSNPDVMLGEVLDSLLAAMGTSVSEIENLRRQCRYQRRILPSRLNRGAVFH